eukprot:5961318-Pyramimonas_sp.AAC.1
MCIRDSLVPSLSRPAKRALLRRIRGRPLDPRCAMVFLAGDFNFYATQLSIDFDNLFPDLCEVEQDLLTRTEEGGGEIVSMA